MNRTTKVSLAVAASAGIFVAGTAGGAVGARLITGDDIATKTIATRNLADESVGRHKLKPRLLASLKAAGKAGAAGATGPAGPAGAKGAKGDKGAKGEPGDPATVEIQHFITSASDAGAVDQGGAYLVPISANGGSGDSETPILTFELTEGSYLVDVTAQFFGGTAGDADYGVITLDQDGANLPGTAWTGDLPGDADNAGQTSGAHLVTVTGGTAEIEVLGSIRGDDAGLAGAQAMVTRVAAVS